MGQGTDIDIVIPLGRGSRWDNGELRYCLRAIERHLSGYRNVWIIGECPKWIKNINHLQATDESPISDFNQYKKFLLACNTAEISDTWLMVNDDHFLLSDFDALKFPNFHKGPLIENTRYDAYGKRLQTTERYLKYKGLPSLNFDVHTPIMFNKSAWLESVHQANWKTESYVIKSLYANQQEIDYIRIDDCKIFRVEDVEEKQIISTYPRLSDQMKVFLKNRFPVKSRYEI